MRERQTPSTLLLEALGLTRRTTARVHDLYNRPLALRPLRLVPPGRRSLTQPDDGREAA